MNSLEFKDFLKKEYETMNSVHSQSGRDFLNQIISNINQRRSFYQHITIIILGFAGLSFFIENTYNATYFKLGLIILFLTVFLILIWLKEVLDSDKMGLEKLAQKYREISQEKMDLIVKYLEKPFTEGIEQSYIKESQELPLYKKLKLDYDRDRMLEQNKKIVVMDFFGEVVIFLFATGVILLFIAVFFPKANIFIVLAVIVATFCFTMQDGIVTKISGIISKVLKNISINHADRDKRAL